MARTKQQNRGYDSRIKQSEIKESSLDLISTYKEEEKEELVSLADVFDLATYGETASIGELEEATRIMNELHDNKN